MTRLRHVTGDALTIERRRSGRGYACVGPDGRALRDEALRRRGRPRAMPPAGTVVRLAGAPRAHIQAIGTDAAGRAQYIYHPEWELRRTRRKQRNLAALAAALPAVRRRVRRDLDAEAGEKALALAIAVALIDRTAMRVGRERYLTANGTRGAGTLYSQDVSVSGARVRIAFPAKSGKRSSYVIEDKVLADAIARIKTIRGRRLLMYRNGNGEPRALRTDDINTYLQGITGVAVSAKDFRTLHASALAAKALVALERAESESGRNRQVADVIRSVAAFLQNTPAICRKSYVAPCLISLFEEGRLAELWSAAPANGSGLRQREAKLAAILAVAG